MNKTIFFIGQGRSGTTIIFDTFARHENIAYLSNYINKLYLPQFRLLNALINKNGFHDHYGKKTFLNKFIPKPSEGYDVWKKLSGEIFLRNFMRDIKADKNERLKIRNYIKKVTKYQYKSNFATKLTGPPRIVYLNSIFPNSFFVNIIRDPRAVVASILNVRFRNKKGFKEPFWDGTLNKNMNKIWQFYNKSKVALVALEWLAIFKQTEYEKNKTECNIYDLKYENFVKKPKININKLFDFLKLDESNNVFKTIKNKKYRNMNYKYKNRLNKTQIKVIEEILETPMKKLKYF